MSYIMRNGFKFACVCNLAIYVMPEIYSEISGLFPA